MLKRKLAVVYWLVLLQCLFLSELKAQDILQYKGPFQVYEYQGDAAFGFRLQEQDTILQGDFRLQSADVRSLLSGKGDNYFSFNGSFEDDIPVGNWQFQFGNFKASPLQPEIDNNHYSVAINGIKHQAFGQLLNGRPHGEWIQLVEQIDRSEVQKNQFKSKLRFNEGIPQQSFSIENSQMTLMGRFLRDGLAHDVWELYSTETPEVAESWHFAEGRLNKIVLTKYGQKETLQAYTNSIENPKVITLDARYLQVIKLNQRLLAESPVQLEGHMEALLAENIKYYSKIEKILSSLGKTEFMPAFKVKVEEYPLSDQEHELVASIEAVYNQAQEISSQLLSSSQLKILQLADEETFRMLLTVNYLNKNHLTFLHHIIHYHDQGVLDYIPRNHQLTELWSGNTITESFEVSYEEQDSTYTFMGLQSTDYDFTQEGLIGVKQVAGYTLANLDSIQNILNQKLRIEEREQALVALEEELMLKVTALNIKVDSMQTEAPDDIQTSLASIKSSAKAELSKYSKKEVTSSKIEEARALVACFENMQALSETLAALPQQRTVIEKKYTDDVWNPFTATVMEEKLKKHIIDAYTEILIPYFLEEAQGDQLCERTLELNSVLQHTNQRMLELVQEDTDKLERKLKREHDPRDILGLLGISATSKSYEQ